MSTKLNHAGEDGDPAPFAGILGLRQVSPRRLRQGRHRHSTARERQLDQGRLRIPENYLSKIRPIRNRGQAGRLSRRSIHGTRLCGRALVDERTRTIAMRARIPNKVSSSKPGMFVRVAVTLDSRPNAVVIPEEANWPQGKSSFVYRVVDGKAALTKCRDRQSLARQRGDTKGPGRQRHNHYRRARSSSRTERREA